MTRRLLGLLPWPPKEGLKGCVVIKPNLLVPLPASTGATTRVEVVRTIAQMCLEAGAGDVVVAESSNWGVDTDEVFKTLGYTDMAREVGCRLLSIKRDEMEEVEVSGQFMRRFRVPVTLRHADYLINVPKLKAHGMAYVTVGLKNLGVGSHTDDQKEMMHRIGDFRALTPEIRAKGSGLDHNIVSVNLAYRCDLTVVDGIEGQEGPGSPLSGQLNHPGVMIAGFDRVGVDAVASEAIGVTPTKVPHLRLAHKAGLGEIDIGRLELVGVPLEQLDCAFEPAVDVHPERFARSGIEVVIGRACYACLSELSYFLGRHVDDLAQLAPVTFCVGDVDRIKASADRRRLVFFGNCARKHLYGGGHVTGCPPRSRRQVFEALGAADLYSTDEGVEGTR